MIMLRKILCIVLTLILQASGSLAAEPTDGEAKNIVDRALAALGGKEKLSGIKAASFKTRGKAYWFGAATDFTGEMAVQGLAKARTLMTCEIMGTKQSIVAVINGDKGWVKTNDVVIDLDAKTLATQMGDHAESRRSTSAAWQFA